MNIVEFAEKILNIQLLESQKQLLRHIEKLNTEKTRVINTRRGYMLIVPDEEHNNIHRNDSNGLRARILLVDDILEMEE